jgi:hypothetical protein
MVQSLDCPHCFTSVLVGSDGSCPHCKKNVNDQAGADTTIRKIWVPNRASLPNYCVHCDKSTNRRISLSRSNRGDPNLRGRPVRSRMGNFVLGLFTVLRASEPYLEIKIDLSQCENCAASRQVQPHEVDFEHMRLSLLVSCGFAERFARASL